MEVGPVPCLVFTHESFPNSPSHDSVIAHGISFACEGEVMKAKSALVGKDKVPRGRAVEQPMKPSFMRW